MRLNNCLIVLTIIIVSVANGEDAHEFMKNHHHHSDQQTKQENILQLECQISAVLQPGNISKFYYLSHRDGEPLTILVTPCSGPVSWTVTSYDTPENNRHQGVDSGSHPSWRLNELIPGSSPLFSYDGDEAQNFTIPCVRAGLYRLEIKTPVDSNKMVRIPKTVLLYATSSPLDHLPISYENTRGNKKRRALRFIPRRNRKRLTVSWSKSHVNPHLSTYCLAVTSGGLPHPPTLCAAKNVLETHSHSRGSSSKEHVHKANPTGLHCVNQTRITLHGLDYDTTYNFTLYVVSKRNNLSTRVASESLKYKKIQAQVLLTDRYVSANLQENFGIINFRYQPQYNKSTEFHVLPCGGGIVKAKLRGPGIKRKKEVTNLELLRAPPLEPGKKYTLRISAIPQELSKVSSVRVLARQAGSIEYPKVPSKKPPREYTPLTNCTEVTVGVEPVGAAEYCVLARELRGTTQLKHSAITSIPDQCGLYRRRRSEYTFDHCENRTDSPRKAEIFKITRLQPGKYYQVQITAQIHGQSLSYPLIKILIYPIVSVGFLGNLGVLVRLFVTPGKTSLKPFYKASLISLALSDLLLLGTTGSNTLALLSSRTVLWSLQEWSCIFLPFLQTTAVLVASLILTGVAIDRFSAFRRKISISRGPGWISTICYVLLVWSVAAGASYPVLDLYKPQSLGIINNSTIYRGVLCVNDREKAKTTYTGLFVVIFLPLTIVFLAIHVMLALSINKRAGQGQCSRLETNFSSENSTASTDIERKTPGIPQFRIPLPAHIQRKRRTVRVILLLILIFVVCRLPQWAFLLFKTLVIVQGGVWWHLQVFLSTLSLFNAAMHPFLYAFLNEALSIVNWIQLIFSKNRKSIDIDCSESRVKESSSGPVKIPRGPYSP